MNRKELIIQSALQNFMEEGYERATMKEIAIEAGVGKGTIYEYFSSKEELFSEVVLTGINKMCDALTQTLSDPGTICEKVKRLYEKNIQLFQSNTGLRAIMLNDFGKIPKQLHEQLQQQQTDMLAQVEKSLQQAIEQEEMTNIHPGIAAAVILNGLQVIYIYQLKEGETYEDVAEQQLRILFSGMKA